jgi:hypothetical protein
MLFILPHNAGLRQAEWASPRNVQENPGKTALAINGC